MLEATNLALNSFEEHWIDRDLQRTGLEIIVLTAGSSYYHVEKNLLRLTTERMLYHGVGLDLISLSKMPLHTVPLFQFRSPDPSAAETSLAVHDSTFLPSTAPRSTVAGSFSRSPVAPSSQLGASHATSHAFHPSSLRHSAKFPASPPLRDPFTSDAASIAASITPSRLTPVYVPDDQRDPLYFDPPPPPHSQAVQHARMTSASIGMSSPLVQSVASGLPSSATTGTAPLPRLGASNLETSLYYMEPGFVFPHFFGTQIDKPHRVDRFMPRARCYELATQGVPKPMPISIPFLSLGADVFSDSITFLSEAEKRQLKRDRHDALAVGAPDPAQLKANGAQWAEVRESGATTGTSGTSSSGYGDGSAWSLPEDREAEARAAHAERRNERLSPAGSGAVADAAVRTPRLTLGRGQPPLTVESPASSIDFADDRPQVTPVTVPDLDRPETTAGDEAEESRGRVSSREGRRNTADGDVSVGRSRTPVPRGVSRQRQARSSSVAASVRTVSSAMSKAAWGVGASASGRKASTPALIARLTGNAGPAASASSPASATAPPPPPVPASTRPSWLNLFGRPPTSSSTSSPIAAPVAVARVDVQASIKPEGSAYEDDGGNGSPVLGHSKATYRGSARQDSDSKDSGSVTDEKTQPIAIGSSGAAATGTRAAGQDKAAARSLGTKSNVDSLEKNGGRMSSSLRAYEPGAAFRRAMGMSGGKISVASRFNPSKPGKRSVGLADQARRWASIVISDRKSMRMGVKWRYVMRVCDLCASFSLTFASPAPLLYPARSLEAPACRSQPTIFRRRTCWRASTPNIATACRQAPRRHPSCCGPTIRNGRTS